MPLFSGEQVFSGVGAKGFQFPETILINSPILAAATLPTIIFVSDGVYQVVSAQEVHTTASSSGTFQVESLTGTTAPGSGTVLLASTLSTAGAANTVVSQLSASPPITINPGDRLALKSGGTQTSLVGSVVSISLKRVG